jgi:hypothetical protein
MMNPNTPRQPYKPQYGQMARPMMGGRNPYGYGMERIQGKLALQRNVPGLPTNTVPLPAMRPRQTPWSRTNRNYRMTLGGY